MSSSQLTFISFRGFFQPPTRLVGGDWIFFLPETQLGISSSQLTKNGFSRCTAWSKRLQCSSCLGTEKETMKGFWDFDWGSIEL